MTKFRSKFEERFYKEFHQDIQGYETNKIDYVLTHTYTPDFRIADNVYLETKGQFHSADRTKMREVIKQNPQVICAIVFMQPNKLLYGGSKTTYSGWCIKNGIAWFDFKDKTGIQAFIVKHKDNK